MPTTAVRRSRNDVESGSDSLFADAGDAQDLEDLIRSSQRLIVFPPGTPAREREAQRLTQVNLLRREAENRRRSLLEARPFLLERDNIKENIAGIIESKRQAENKLLELRHEKHKKNPQDLQNLMYLYELQILQNTQEQQYMRERLEVLYEIIKSIFMRYEQSLPSRRRFLQISSPRRMSPGRMSPRYRSPLRFRGGSIKLRKTKNKRKINKTRRGGS